MPDIASNRNMNAMTTRYRQLMSEAFITTHLQVEDTRSDTEEEDEYETEKEENGQCNGVEHHEPSMTNGSTKRRVNGNANIIAENGTANGKKSAKRETTL